MILKEVTFGRRIELMTHEYVLTIQFTVLLSVRLRLLLAHNYIWPVLVDVSSCSLFGIELYGLERTVVFWEVHFSLNIGRIVHVINRFESHGGIDQMMLDLLSDPIEVFLVVLFFVVFTVVMSESGTSLV